MSIIPDEEFLTLKCQVGDLQCQMHNLKSKFQQTTDEISKIRTDAIKRSENTIGMKICLARDSVENWEESTRILLPGELAIAYDS